VRSAQTCERCGRANRGACFVSLSVDGRIVLSAKLCETCADEVRESTKRELAALRVPAVVYSAR
jgi:hypothetical protein